MKLTKDERERVDAMLYLSQELRQAYHLKERFYEVLDAKEPEVSAKLMGDWILEAQNSGLSEYENCGNTFIAWGKGILNSSKYSYTNGFTEGRNNKIKVLKRNAYGYRDFKRLRNRILFMFYWRDSRQNAAYTHIKTGLGLSRNLFRKFFAEVCTILDILSQKETDIRSYHYLRKCWLSLFTYIHGFYHSVKPYFRNLSPN